MENIGKEQAEMLEKQKKKRWKILKRQPKKLHKMQCRNSSIKR